MKNGAFLVVAIALASPAMAWSLPALAQGGGDPHGDPHGGGSPHGGGDPSHGGDPHHGPHGQWHAYRHAHPGIYRVGPYPPPTGYVYRPVAVGYRFPAVYVGQRYWITNWRVYRLPPPGAGYRWIRYGNDVVLIRTDTRAVVVVHRSFFL